MVPSDSFGRERQMMKKIEAIIRNPRARLRPTSAPSLCPPARHIYSWAIYHRDASSPTGGEEASLFIIVRSGCTLLIHHPLSLRGNCHDSSRQLPRYFVMIAKVLSWPPAKGPPPNPVWLCCPCLCQHLPPLRWRSCVTASENATNNPACRKCPLRLKTQGVVPQKQAK